MSEENKKVNENDPKAKMLAALAKKQKGGNSGKAGGPSSGSKIGAGQTGGAAPKMHGVKLALPKLCHTFSN